MEIVVSLLVGILFGAGVFCLLRRSMMKLVVGIILISQATNLLVFTAAGLTEGRPAFVPAGAEAPAPPYGDPLAQALVLTAIVIGFGLVVFTLALLHRTHQAVQSDDLKALTATDLNN